MTIQHHLTDDLIMAYAAGTLTESLNLVIATHLSLCDDCRAAVASYEAVGGAVIETGARADVSDACLEGALALIRGRAPAPRPQRRAPDPVFPNPLRDYVGCRLADVSWRPLGMGVKHAVIPTQDEATARLLYIPAGTAMPNHSHKGMELTLVLQGAFEDADGRFGRGDIEVADPDLHHTPIADVSQDCICLAVTDAPLRFKGFLPRLAQSFLKI